MQVDNSFRGLLQPYDTTTDNNTTTDSFLGEFKKCVLIEYFHSIISNGFILIAIVDHIHN